jgi:Tol biopolymer transport system component
VNSGAGAPVQVTALGGYSPYFSLDGKRLFYTRTRSQPKGLYEMNVETGRESLVDEDAGGALYGYWTASEAGLYFATNTSRSAIQLRFFDYSSRQVRPYLTIDAPVVGSPGISLSPDGKWIAYNRPENLGSDLMLVENFH